MTSTPVRPSHTLDQIEAAASRVWETTRQASEDHAVLTVYALALIVHERWPDAVALLWEGSDQGPYAALTGALTADGTDIRDSDAADIEAAWEEATQDYAFVLADDQAQYVDQFNVDPEWAPRKHASEWDERELSIEKILAYPIGKHVPSQTYTLQQVRQGTGWAAGTRFRPVVADDTPILEKRDGAWVPVAAWPGKQPDVEPWDPAAHLPGGTPLPPTLNQP